MRNRYQTVAGIAGAADPAPEQLIEALSLLAGLRQELDRFERALIASARERRIGWAQISAALGLASRQASEQRLLRLAGDATRNPARVRTARARQQIVDSGYGPRVSDLRVAVLAAHGRVAADPAWDSRHPRAALLRISLDAAAQASPGALYTLVSHAIEDLDAMPPEALPAAVAAALARLRRAATAARPD